MMMAMPYKVKVASQGANDIKIDIKPRPVVTDEDYTLIVAGRFQKAMMDKNVRNTVFGRARLQREIEDILKDFHGQGIIKPREEDTQP
jgi:hypothetical protein